MVMQIKQNLPLFVSKQATLLGPGLPEMLTISANIIKKKEEDINPGLSAHPDLNPEKPPTNFAPPTGSNPGTLFVELPTIDPSRLPPPPNLGVTMPTATIQPTVKDEPQFVCTAILALAHLPPEWAAKQGTEIPFIKIRTIAGERSLVQATYWFDEKTSNFFIEAKTFE